jgi:hypothetical protein
MSERQILVLPTMSAEQMCVGPPKREYNTMSASNEVPPTTVLNPTNSTRLACNAICIKPSSTTFPLDSNSHVLEKANPKMGLCPNAQEA